LDEHLTQIISAQPGYRVVIIDHYQQNPSWSIIPVTAWGLVRDDEHDLEDRPGHWEGVVALWPHEDASFPVLTWERDGDRHSQLWLMLGPNDEDPSAADITNEWRKRHEAWPKNIKREKVAALVHERDVRDNYKRLLAEVEARIRKLESETGQDTA
jgi:hypothetical protein